MWPETRYEINFSFISACLLGTEVLCNYIPYRAKLCWAKFPSVKTIHRAKFSSPNEKFVTFARRKILPKKIKKAFSWSKSEPKRKASHLDKLWLSCWAKHRRAKYLSLLKKIVTFARQSFDQRYSVALLHYSDQGNLAQTSHQRR